MRIIWPEKDRNMCQLKLRVNKKPHERKICPYDYFGINKIVPSKRAAKRLWHRRCAILKNLDGKRVNIKKKSLLCSISKTELMNVE